MLSIKERQDGNITVLALEGNVIMGGGSARLRDALRRLVESNKRNIVLNFEGVKYIDSSGIGELVASLVSLSRNGGHLKLSNLPERVVEVMTLSSLLSIFDVYATEADALKEAE